MEVSFKLEKETKNTYRFQEVDEEGEVKEWADVEMGTIYLNKRNFSKRPNIIKLTVEL